MPGIKLLRCGGFSFLVDGAAIDLRDLTKHYNAGKVRAVAGVNLQVQRGEVFGLIGPNGAGKSTLMGLMLGLLRPTSGEVSIFGRAPVERGIRRITGYLPERPYFDAWMTLEQFLLYHHRLSRRPESEAKRAIGEVLERVGLGGEVGKRQIKKLSRGMLQRLGLAQMLIGRPKLCFLDEPASGMDPVGTQLVRSIILELKSHDCTVVLNSHHLDEVERTCDRVAVIVAGSIQAMRDLRQVEESEQKVTLRIALSKVSEPVGEATLRELVEPLGGRLSELSSEGIARFELPGVDVSSVLIETLVHNLVRFDEAVLERSTLEDLFKSLLAK